MDTLLFVIGVIGNIISILMFLSPGRTFVRIVKKQSTEEFESLPYICTLLSSSLWTYYGLIKPGSYLVATVNAFGVVVEIVYVALFLSFAPPSQRRKTAAYCGILNVGGCGAAIFITYWGLDGEMRINAVGLMCSGLNIIMYASPLSALKRVVRRKSVEYMPILVSVFVMLNGGVWTLYALLPPHHPDCFLGVPNAIGFVLGVVQIVLYAIYRSPKAAASKQQQSPEANLDQSLLQKEPLFLAPSASAHC